MKKIVIVYGRMNPIHRGHDYMINFAESLAHETDADFKIFTSKTHNKKTDPLTFEEKESLFRSLYGHNILGDSGGSTIFSVIEHLESEGYTDIKLVVGGDQVKTFSDLFTKYQKDYSAKLSVSKFADRNKYNISASDMRQFALDGDFKSFQENCPEHMLISNIFETYRSVSVTLQGHVRNTNVQSRQYTECSHISD